MTRFQQSTISVCVVRRIVSIVQKKRSIYFGSENIFFAPHKKMTNQKFPAQFWARSSGHGPLVMKSSAQNCAGDFSVPYQVHCYFRSLFLDHFSIYCGIIYITVLPLLRSIL